MRVVHRNYLPTNLLGQWLQLAVANKYKGTYVVVDAGVTKVYYCGTMEQCQHYIDTMDNSDNLIGT